MSDVLLDTQKMVERLQAAGVPPAQARAHTELLVEAINGHCVSKEDLAEMQAHIDARFDRLQANTDARFEKLQASTDKRFDSTNARLDKLQASTDERFDKLQASTDERFDKSQASTDARFDKLQASMDARFEKSQVSTDARFDGVNQRITTETALLREAIAGIKIDLMKWVATVGIFQVAVISLLLKLA